MDITPVALELPFIKSQVNVYLVKHRHGLLLVDTGPHAPRSFLDLTERISAMGYTLPDVTHIIITHGHFDHFGLAASLKKASGALVCYHPLDRSRIAEDKLQQTAYSATQERLQEMGFSEEYVQAGAHAHSVLDGGRWALYQNVPADVSLADGDRLPAGSGTLEVVHCPGHTPGSICLWGRSAGVLFTGDHVLSQPLGEVLLEPQVAAPPGEETSAVAFFSSLDKVAGLPVRTYYPGHGSPGTDLAQRVQAIKCWLDEQCERILACLAAEPLFAGRSPVLGPGWSAFQINQMLEGPTHLSLETVGQICQVTHCLQLLLDRSAVHAERDARGAIYYRLSSSAPKAWTGR